MFNFLFYDYCCIGLLFVLLTRRFLPKSHRNHVIIPVRIAYHTGRCDPCGLKWLWNKSNIQNISIKKF